MRSIYVNGKLVAVLFDTDLEVSAEYAGIDCDDYDGDDDEGPQIPFMQYVESLIVSNVQYDGTSKNIEGEDITSEMLLVRAEYQCYVEQWHNDHDEGDPVCFNEWYDNEHQA